MFLIIVRAVERSIDRLGDASLHRLIIAEMRLTRSMHPAIAIKPQEVDRVPRLFGKLFEIEKLCPAISLAERMHIVDITENLARFLSEFGSG